MKKILIFLIIGFILAGMNMAGNCQNESDSGLESSIEQSESSAGQNLESEIRSEQSSGNSEMGEMEQEMKSQNY